MDSYCIQQKPDKSSSKVTSNPTMTSNKESVKPGNSHNVQSVNNVKFRIIALQDLLFKSK